MRTILVKKNKLALIPAGIIEGTEAFWHNNEKWVLHEGRAMRFHSAPGSVQRLIAEAFLNDRKSTEYLKKHEITGFADAFETWYHCIVGGLDHVPDFMDGKFNPDAYNNFCQDYDCEHRGKFCSLEAGLKNYEIKTVKSLAAGLTQKQTAAVLNVSPAGMKSRVEKIKMKLRAKNTAQLIARASEMGI